MRHINYIEHKILERDDYNNLVVKSLPFDPLPENFELWRLSDIHEGNIARCEKTLDKVLSRIKSKKNAYVELGGDQMETINISDKRYNIEVHGHRSSRAQDQRDALISRLDKIGDRIVAILDGNHETNRANYHIFNKDIAKEFNTIYANGTAVKHIFPKFRIMSVHGDGIVHSRAGDPLQRKTNELIALKRNLRRLPADDCEISWCGHYHNIWIHEPSIKLCMVSSDKIIPNKNPLEHVYAQPGRIWIDQKKGFYRIPEEEKWYVCTGSFLKGYMEDCPSYVENRCLSPNELGCVYLEVKNGKPVKIHEYK